MDEQLTFGGESITLSYVNGEVFITCKELVGTLTQIEGFMNELNGKRHYFGDCKIRQWRGNIIKIDCLQDTRQNFNYLYKQTKLFKDGKS